MIKANKLRNRLDWERRQLLEVGNRGQPDYVWVAELEGVGAEIVTSGKKLELSRQLHEETTHVVTMRKQAIDITTDRFKWGDKYLYPMSLTDIDQRNRVIQMDCMEDDD